MEGRNTAHAMIFLMEALDDKWESPGQGPHTARTIISNPLFHSLCTSPPDQSCIFFSFPAVAVHFPCSPAHLLGTEAFVLSNPLDPSREALHGYPQGTLILLLQSPWLSDCGVTSTQYPCFGLTLQNPHLKRELSISCGALKTAGLWPTTGTT